MASRNIVIKNNTRCYWNQLCSSFFGLLVFGDWVHLRLRSIGKSGFRFWNPEFQRRSALGTRLKSVHRVDSNPDFMDFLALTFYCSIEKSEKGFTKLFSWTAVLFLLIMRACARPFFLSWQFFKSFFGFLNRTVGRKLAWEWKIIFISNKSHNRISKAEYLTSFWNRGPGELGNGLLKSAWLGLSPTLPSLTFYGPPARLPWEVLRYTYF